MDHHEIHIKHNKRFIKQHTNLSKTAATLLNALQHLVNTINTFKTQQNTY